MLNVKDAMPCADLEATEKLFPRQSDYQLHLREVEASIHDVIFHLNRLIACLEDFYQPKKLEW